MINVIIENKIGDSKPLFNCLASVGFWNGNGFEGLNIKEILLKEFEQHLKNTSFKCGFGGSHLWVSNQENKRLLLITINN
jgi:hypothetical protein